MPVSSIVSTTGHPDYSKTLPCVAESAEPARQLVRTALRAWGMEPLEDDGALVVTELVANAARHTRGRLIRVSVTCPVPGQVRIGAVDRSKVRPRRGNSDDLSESGRGLALVELLTVRWGTDLLPFGKRVWGVLNEEPAA
ncbi:ATP-binding protein [Streptomyces sp. PRB2-1]|uniref:ATP-binding protein n=1 Tax=Actinacidiphila epipremni TaxID=2053013 RepID=A0ABX0ZH97_9ACTN|nr:ATP-binding protein [Actinacidiphila epipremni]